MSLLGGKSKAKQFYKFFSLIYDFVNPFFYSEEMKREFTKLAEVRGSELVLDEGVGSAYTAEGLLREGRDSTIVGIDLSAEMLNRAKAKLRRIEANWHLVLGDVEELPFKEEVFDLVTSAGVMEYIPDCRKMMSEITRVLKRGGGAVILAPREPDSLPLRALVRSFMKFFTLEQLSEMMSKSGMEKVSGFSIGPRRMMSKLAVVVRGEKPLTDEPPRPS